MQEMSCNKQNDVILVEQLKDNKAIYMFNRFFIIKFTFYVSLETGDYDQLQLASNIFNNYLSTISNTPDSKVHEWDKTMTYACIHKNKREPHILAGQMCENRLHRSNESFLICKTELAT